MLLLEDINTGFFDLKLYGLGCLNAKRLSEEVGILLSAELLCILFHRKLKLSRLLYFIREVGMLEVYSSLLLPKESSFRVLRGIFMITPRISLEFN